MFKARLAVAVALLGASVAARADVSGVTILTEDFNADPSSLWTYSGVQNSGGQNLFRWNASGRLDAEWDQGNTFDYGDPYTIQPSYYARPLGQTLTDADTFCVRATLTLSSINNTSEYYQIANFGLYGLANMGADRAMADNWSGNTTIVEDASDFVEFNYFINNDTTFGWYRNTGVTMGAHIDGDDGDYTYGSFSDSLFHNTDMGMNQALPTGTPLYIELSYYGETTRRAYMGIYTDSDRTALLSVNGVEQYYWTMPLPADDHFTLTHVAFWNYVAGSWGGPYGEGAGSFDDLSVVVAPEPASAVLLLGGLAGMLAVRRRGAPR